jgi:AraC-like DNA-binding protein
MSDKEFVYREYVRRESEFIRTPYNSEMEFYNIIKSGDVKLVRERCMKPFSENETGWGELSDDYCQNFKYHFAITIALISRYCIEAGMEMPRAYDLSDYYIRKCDRCDSVKQIDELHREAVLEYAGLMNKLRKICSMPVAKSMDYISDNLHRKITVAELAENSGISASHLSREFKRETGFTIGNYIQDMKLDTAKNMLLYSEFTPAEIAGILAFSDQSYFTELFRKKYGMPPGKYKREHFREMKL